MNKREQIETQLEMIEDLPLQLGPIHRDSKSLADKIAMTCKLAEAVSKKVRDLDRTRERLNTTLSKVHDVIDVKNCIKGVSEAMAKEDYETAAAHIHRYRTIDKSVLEAKASEELKNWEQKLRDVVHTRLEDALKRDDQNDITRFCELYSPLGLKEEGLNNYSTYLRRLIKTEADTILQIISSNSTSLEASPLGLNRFYSFIDKIIKAKQAMIKQNFNNDGMLKILQNINEECSIHCVHIVRNFIRDFKIPNTTLNIGKYKKKQPSNNSSLNNNINNPNNNSLLSLN